MPRRQKPCAHSRGHLADIYLQGEAAAQLGLLQARFQSSLVLCLEGYSVFEHEQLWQVSL